MFRSFDLGTDDPAKHRFDSTSGKTAASVTDFAPRDVILNTNEDGRVAAQRLASHARFKRVFAAPVHDGAHFGSPHSSEREGNQGKCGEGKVAEVCSLATTWRVSITISC